MDADPSFLTTESTTAGIEVRNSTRPRSCFITGRLTILTDYDGLMEFYSDRSVCGAANVEQCLIMPRPLGGALSDDARLTSVCLSRTSGLSRKQRGLWRLKLAQRWPTSHVTRTPFSRSKGQRSRSQGRGILWRPPAQLVTAVVFGIHICELIFRPYRLICNVTSTPIWEIGPGQNFSSTLRFGEVVLYAYTLMPIVLIYTGFSSHSSKQARPISAHWIVQWISVDYCMSVCNVVYAFNWKIVKLLVSYFCPSLDWFLQLVALKR